MSELTNMSELKALDEQKADLIQQMKDLTNQVTEVEKRAFSDEEQANFDSMQAQVEALNKTMKAAEQARAMEFKANENEEKKVMENELTQEEMDVRAFAAYVRNEKLDERADNLTYSDNGAVIPASIANKIIQKVYDICPIYEMATRYDVKGSLTVPYYDESDSAITMAYADEFNELESTSGKFTSIELKGFLAGVLTLVSRQLVNNSDFDITNFVVDAMAQSIARWIEGELLNGTSGKVEGLSGVKQTVEGALEGDTLIDAQETVPDVYQNGAIWIMNPKTRAEVRKLKDANGDYYLNPDMTAQWGYTLLGKPVYCSDNMAEDKIYYGDMTGLAVKVAEEIDIQVLYEHYATQHAIGIVGWVDFDSKVEDAQKIVAINVTESADDPEKTNLRASATATTSSKKKSE